MSQGMSTAPGQAGSRQTARGHNSPGTAVVRIYALLVGVGEVLTGLLLIFVPELVQSLLAIEPIAEPVWLRWIGVFIAQVGTLYLYPWWRVLTPCSAQTPTASLWPAILELTAVARFSVAAFLAWAINTGALPTAWIIVLAFDFTLATIQLVWLRRGGLDAIEPIDDVGESR